MKIKTPLKAIRDKCYDCVITADHIKTCPCTDCALWYYRFGRRPDTVRETNKKLLDKKLFDTNKHKSHTEMDKLLS